MSPFEFNRLIRQMHALVGLRHLEADPMEVGIVFTPTDPKGTHLEPLVKPYGTLPKHDALEFSETCAWEAKVRLGGGKWGHSVGLGMEPAEALTWLYTGWYDSHGAVDQRRAQLRARAEPVYTALKAAQREEKSHSAPPEGSTPRSVTCHAETREPDGYVTVDAEGEVRVGGQPLTEVKDVHVLQWVAQVVPVFLATGKRAPMSGLAMPA